MDFKPNDVQLLGYYGGDETHALSAWVSTRRELTCERQERLPDFLARLAQADPPHTVPFEKSMLHFLIRAETATHIHILKHRAGVSVNGESARYKELREDKCYVPEDWPEDLKEVYMEHIDQSYQLYHSILADLEPMLGRKRAKESARFVLPYGNQTWMDVTFNFNSFVHFQTLRNHGDAQDEVRMVADRMLELVRSLGTFQHSLAAFGLA